MSAPTAKTDGQPPVSEPPQVLPAADNFPEVIHKQDPAAAPEVAAYYYSPDGYDSRQHRPPARLCGQTPLLACLLVGLIALIVGGAIGGGVGTAVANNSWDDKLKAASASATTTATVTVTATVASAAADATEIPISIGCPGTEGTYYTSKIGSSNYTSKFQVMCSRLVPGKDITTIMTRTFDACIEGCASFNFYNITAGATQCKSVAFIPSWINPVYSQGNITRNGTCYLKNSATGFESPSWNFEFASAKLV